MNDLVRRVISLLQTASLDEVGDDEIGLEQEVCDAAREVLSLRRQARLTKLLDGTLSSLQARFRETLIYFDSQVLGELHAEDFVAGELSAAMVIVNELT